MIGSKYKNLLYFIIAVILTTLCTQVYWNYKNYQTGEQQFKKDVLVSLDAAVDHYFTKLAAETSFEMFAISDQNGLNFNTGKTIIVHDTIIYSTKERSLFDTLQQSIKMVKSDWTDRTNLDISVETLLDSLHLRQSAFDTISENSNIPNKFTRGIDSTMINELSSKIMISFSENKLSLPLIDSLFKEELAHKKMELTYGLSYSEYDKPTDTIHPKIVREAELSGNSHSPYLLHDDSLKIHYSNISFAVLQKSIIGILLSFLLIGSVIGCLLYLLKIIRKQKEVAAIKNDLISNITHEFKTPIATIGVAMEAIENFNSENDLDKNLRYAKISRAQVKKLDMMVEKLLETAALDSEKLELQMENTNLVQLLEKASTQEEFMVGGKTILFTSSESEIWRPVDPFHFENAINNIIDNAIKYGGNLINVSIRSKKQTIEIEISDTGSELTEIHKKQLFEKFYRVPKGNTHDVKGFGIGLYYTQKIIEKHHGSIKLSTRPSTSFKISLLNG